MMACQLCLVHRNDLLRLAYSAKVQTMDIDSMVWIAIDFYLVWWINTGRLINAVRRIGTRCVGVVWLRWTRLTAEIVLRLSIFPCIQVALLTIIPSESRMP